MSFPNYFPVWDQLHTQQQSRLLDSLTFQSVKRGTILHGGSMDKRVASFLLQESSIEGSRELRTTHEAIANHLGSHREVVTRMLRKFQKEGMVKLSRGKVTILDKGKLEALRT